MESKIHDPFKSLNEVFNVESNSEALVPEIMEQEISTFVENEELIETKQESFTDSEKIRITLDITLEKAQRALDVILSETEANPLNRSAENLSKLIDSIGKLTTTLSDLNYREMEVGLKRRGKDNNPEQVQQVTNNTLVLSSSELLEKIAKRLGR